MRADRQPFAGSGLLEISQPHPGARCRRPALRGRARHRARRSQPRLETAWPVVSGRYLHRLPRHHRRHDRQQFLRRAFAALRQYARERAVGRRDPRRRIEARISARCGRTCPILPAESPLRGIARDLLEIGAREVGEIETRFPKVQRRVGGYNLDSFLPGRNALNLAHILIGSEGTLGFSTKIELKLSPLLGRRAVGACHFGSFYEAMNAAQHLVKLAPDRGRAGRPHHDRARARDRDVQADAGAIRARLAGRRAAR